MPTTSEILRYGYNELDDADTRKEGRVSTLGDVHIALSDGQGNLTAGTASVTISDLNGRPIVKRLSTLDHGYFYGDQIEVFCRSDLGRRTSATPRRLARVLLDADSYENNAEAAMSGTDPFFALNTSPFAADKKFPTYTFPHYYSNAPEDVFSKYMPVILGEVSDEGAIDPQTGLSNARGKCPLTFTGIDPQGTGPGGRAENWGAFFVCLFPAYKIISLYGVDLSSAITGIANAVSDGADQSTITLGGSPDLSLVVTATAAVVANAPGAEQNPLSTLTLFTGIHGQMVKATIIAVNNSTKTVQVNSKIPVIDTYGFADSTGTALGVDWMIGQWTNARVKIDIAARQGVDVLVPGYAGYNRPTPYETFTETTGVYRVTQLMVRGLLLQAHLNGGPTLAANVIGVEDKGDGTGLPITDYFKAEYWWWMNCVNYNSKAPGGPGGLWPQNNSEVAGIGGAWSDGTYKINGLSFAAAQTWSSRLKVGGAKINAYFGEPRGMRDVAQSFLDNVGGMIVRTGVNEHGQIFKWTLDANADTSAWVPIVRAERVFGAVKRWNAKPEIENVTQGPCDYDPDSGTYRRGTVTIKSFLGIRNAKENILPSKTINGEFVADIDQWTATLQLRNNFTANGPWYVTLDNCDPGLWDYHLGSGILYTDDINGLIAEPMYILSKTFHLDTQSVDLVCLDVGAGPIAAGTPRTAPPVVGVIATQPTSTRVSLVGYAPTLLTAKVLSNPSGSISVTGRAPTALVENQFGVTDTTAAAPIVTDNTALAPRVTA